MTKERVEPDPDEFAFEAGAAGNDRRNRRLLEVLSHDWNRRALFTRINNEQGGTLKFPSRDAAPRECDGAGYDRPRAQPVPGHMPVTLVTKRCEIERILDNDGGRGPFSSRVYAELGGGNFMLALDPKSTPAHEAQVAAFHECFPRDTDSLIALAHAACGAAAVMAFRVPELDLAVYAEQSALRFVQMLMGYALRDFPLLQQSLRAAYGALVYQVFERHFVSDPTLIPRARQSTGQLLTRTSQLIDAYDSHDKDALKGTRDPSRPDGTTPVLEALAGLPDLAKEPFRHDFNGEQRAVLAVGAAIGIVGNVQATACIAVEGLFANSGLMAAALELCRSEDSAAPMRKEKSNHWKKLIAPLLCANPPIPYLPRLELDASGNKKAEYLLALGGATALREGKDGDDPLVWGWPGVSKHPCAGQALAWPLIAEIVRQVIALPELAQGLDPANGKVKGLKKRHGFACESYPFTYRRDKVRAQTSLNVVMRIKPPVKDNADRVRETIASGAPRIEAALRESRHIHFAWFEMIEADTVLVLHTVYDGPFGAYLQHFALVVGDLFDVLFEFIEDPPPTPVHKFPEAFAAHLLRYNRTPAMGYFFSAYPNREVARILREQGRGP